MCVRKVASEVFGVSRGDKQEAKDTWWWNDKVQRAIKEKKECFKRLHLDKSATNIEGYKIAKRAAKRAVSVAKGQAYDNLYQRLGTKEGEKDIYRMARIRERKTRDINQIKCIKDGVDRLLVRDEEIKDRWREYFDKLFNGEEEGPILELDDSFDDNNRRFVRRIQETEIEEALKRMKSGKAMGPDGIPIEVYVSTVEAYKYPITCTQWHPEKAIFEWRKPMIPHSEDAVQVTQHFANHFISQARKSPNRPPADKVLDNLIYNYRSTFSGKTS
ncbi:hypothetical protein PR202_ga05678 [Eleusine coracana subsp. coracana]|uniref:Uncharacterized protein n=1 Tax=Eleusine coracana subsp. coracana TaxID=191504 RepID=A0AAV5BTG0_ELECO|nr:hypothetical protein PR202_ga05224 [Eleusine coracana subsp. coracana]GJM89481.1 hypothetical protein PR202_ga05678 [Eleusine coracana subsp. coracana]